MISGLIGVLYGMTGDSLLVNVNGLIYRVQTSGRSLTAAGETGSRVELHTHLVVREDALTLFGFVTEAELTWFETLIGVNGVGPRLACAVLTRLSSDSLVEAISNERVDVLSAVPGIGKRTASRIILDLRGKLPDSLDPLSAVARHENTDVIAALQALGYTTSEIQAAMFDGKLDSSDSTENQILAALRQLGGA